MIFQEEKYHKNRSNFPGDIVQDFVITHKLFQENDIQGDPYKIIMSN